MNDAERYSRGILDYALVLDAAGHGQCYWQSMYGDEWRSPLYSDVDAAMQAMRRGEVVARHDAALDAVIAEAGALIESFAG